MTEAMKGMTMIASTRPAVQHADAERRAVEQRAEDRQRADVFVEPRIHVFGEHRHEHEQAPHAVDDRRDAGEQFDRRADRAAQPLRRHLGEEHRDAEADRHARSASR